MANHFYVHLLQEEMACQTSRERILNSFMNVTVASIWSYYLYIKLYRNLGAESWLQTLMSGREPVWNDALFTS